MSIETAVFAVQRGGQVYSCKGSDLNRNIVGKDLFAVQRGDTTYKLTQGQVQDNDLLACTDTDGVTYKVTGDEFRDLIVEPWEGAETIYHIFTYNYNTINVTNQDNVYNVNTRLEVPNINTGGEWIVTGKDAEFSFSKGKWDFGDLTDTSNVTNMKGLFHESPFFNSDISNWDVANVTDMRDMFFNAREFTSDLSGWNVDNVTDMRNMFRNAQVFTSDLSNWNVDNVANMYDMFYGSRKFTSDISNWDVGNVTDMSNMFSNANVFNSDIGNWDVRKVTRMDYMLYSAQAFNQDLSGWCVTEISSAPTLFRTSSGMPTDDSYNPKWGTCPGPWSGAVGIYHVIVTDPDDIEITNQSKIYNFATEAEVSSIDAAGEWIVTGPNTKFKNSTGNWSFGNQTDTSNVTNMHDMFHESRAFNSDLSGWDVSNVTNMSNMFQNAQVFDQDISDWKVSNVTKMDYMFNNAQVFDQDLSNWCVTNIKNKPSGFDQEADAWIKFNSKPCWGHCPPKGDPCPLPPWHGAAGVYHVIINDPADITITNQDRIYNLDTRDVVSSINAGGEWIITGPNTKFKDSIGNWEFGSKTDISKATDMSDMFRNAKLFNQNISKWNVKNVTNMSHMFDGAQAFDSNLYTWLVSNVTDMDGMFYNAQAFNANLEYWCVDPEPRHTDFSTNSGMPSDGSYDPKWGTCIPPDPWVGADAIYHVNVAYFWDINVTGEDKVYKLANKQEYGYINAGGEWIITGVNTKFRDSDGNWTFGNQTDTSQVTDMSNMFAHSPAFNQDLTGWCVPNIISEPSEFKTSSGMPSDGSNDPKWGTCP